MSVDPFLIAWSKAFALTVLIQLPIVFLCLESALPPKGRRLGIALFAQLASHPAVWFVFPRLGLTYWLMVAFAEAWAVLSETAFYALLAPTSVRRAVLVALAANTASFGIGLIVRALTGWV